eukprot:gene17338-biopygen13665
MQRTQSVSRPSHSHQCSRSVPPVLKGRDEGGSPRRRVRGAGGGSAQLRGGGPAPPRSAANRAAAAAREARHDARVRCASPMLEPNARVHPERQPPSALRNPVRSLGEGGRTSRPRHRKPDRSRTGGRAREPSGLSGVGEAAASTKSKLLPPLAYRGRCCRHRLLQ